MTWLADTLMLAHGWRRLAMLFAAGLVASLSVAPLFAWPALFLAFPVWVWALDGAERGRGWRRLFGPAFFIGFAFGMGYFLPALHWLVVAGFVDGGLAPLFMGLAVLALCVALSILWGLGSAVAHLFWSPGALRIVILAVSLAAAEFVRGHFATGFPFDLLGYALTGTPEMMQAASLIGVYGLSAVAPLVAMTPALIWPADGRSWTRRLIPLSLGLALLALQLGYGYQRLQNTELVAQQDVRLRLVQPVVLEHVDWRRASPPQIIERLVALSSTRLTPEDQGLAGVTHLVWPESSLPFYLSDHAEAYARIARMLPDGVMLLTGAPRRPNADPEAQADAGGAYNSLLAIDTQGEIVATYDKTHLVPVGEYVPFAELLEPLGLRQIAPGSTGWLAGRNSRLMSPPGSLPFVALICYEAIFPGDLGADLARARFILNISNDAWFDYSIGLAQHAHHARLRSVETGLAMARVANTGLTFMVDPLGRITASVAPYEAGLVDVTPDMPVATLFRQFGHWPFFGMLLCGWLAGLIDMRRARRVA